ncbi:O-methylsterigmatocystin oxidoreductase [Grifola frondosa]|uniref:O-methylsterigmatocystin oxidoreductase n=1 Tax=Grifola frondosa TaxID=5627 RepID=A0A1C7LS17_GRIFR|nr:O-methylsterigmatocystin oxidoreductase [Grifola frondosa]
MSPSLLQTVTVLVTLSIMFWRGYLKRPNHVNLPLPPGPKPLPIIGNISDIPKEYPWLTYREMSDRYGDLVYLGVLGQSIIIAGSSKVAIDLFEKRSSMYSDRVRSIMFVLTGWEWNLGFMPYGKLWRRTRRTFHQHFNQVAIPKYRGVQLRESRRFLYHLLTSPDNAFGATMLKMVYGIELAEDDTEYTATTESALEGVIEGLVPGRFWVEFFPFLRHIPSWVPGAGFQKKLATWRADAHAMRDVPYAIAKHAHNEGIASPSIARELFEKHSRLEGDSAVREDGVAKNAVGVAYAGGADTKAQAELDAVVGPDRLPDFSDRDALPYVNAIALECFRWQPVLPLGVPHCSMADDVYNGYSIPSGSMIIPNIWAFTRDTDVYVEPERSIQTDSSRMGGWTPAERSADSHIRFWTQVCPIMLMLFF